MTSDNSKVIAEAMQSKAELFAQKAILKHGNLYDYSNVSLKSNHESVKIICKKHGEFTQRATNHLQGRGCRKCSAEKVSAVHRGSFDDFVKRAVAVHGEIYSYPTQFIKNLDNKVKIICPTHGEFEQIGHSHLNGKICIKCANRENLTTNGFILKAKKVHGDVYDYQLVQYINSQCSVKINCPIHGIFEQAANHHLEGHGCKQCSLQNTHRRTIYEQVCKGNSNLYIIKCSNDQEEFYKIGISKHRLGKRFNPSNMPYKFDEIAFLSDSAGIIWDLEKTLQRLCKNYKYLPKQVFSGSKHECFSCLPKEVLTLIERLSKTPQAQLII